MDSDGYLLRRNPLQHGVADAVHRPTQLTFRTFLKLYMRSFFLQGSFSVKYRQNIGFAFCMEPVGRILWDDREKRKAFLLRHMEYYNGNPFMITLVIGAVAKMEEMLRYDSLRCNQLRHNEANTATESISEDDISRFKKSVGAATGSIGDRFFWNALRSFGIIFGLFVAFFYGLWGVLLVLAVFSIPTLVLNWCWLKTGYRLGTGVVTVIKDRKLESTAQKMETVSAALLAFLSTLYVLIPGSTLNWISGAASGLFVLSFFLLSLRLVALQSRE